MFVFSELKLYLFICLFVCIDQVRKTSQAALLVLLEQEVVERGETETCL